MVCYAFWPVIHLKNDQIFDILILWEEFILLQNIKVSIFFLANSLLLVIFEDDMNSVEKTLKRRMGIKEVNIEIF